MFTLMTTQVLVKKLDKEVKGLKKDLREMKKFIFSPLKDEEGEYKASFVKKMLSRAGEKGPFHRFSGKESFLRHVGAKK